MEPDPFEEVIATLPNSVQKRLKNCPQPGLGINPWCLSTARCLVEHFEGEDVIAILEAHVSESGRDRDIRRAVSAARGYANGERGSTESWRLWPAVDYATVHKIVLGSRVRLKQLQANSPVHVGTDRPMTEQILDALFPGDPLLCFGRSPNYFSTRPREFWRGKESSFQFIVPNTMTNETGLTRDGKVSRRCLDNTGPRRFLVIEFDISEDDGKWAPYVREWKAKGISVLDANVALLLELARRGLPRLPLALAVHSAGKSLHAWYWCEGLTDEQLRPFMERAVRLGADYATWTKCQLVRMPDGTRDNGKRQQVHFFAPEVIRRREVQNGSCS